VRTHLFGRTLYASAVRFQPSVSVPDAHSVSTVASWCRRSDSASHGWPTASALQRDDPPVGQAIQDSIKQFKESGDVEKRKALRRPCRSEKNVKHVRLSCQFRERNSYLLIGVCTWVYLKRRFETSFTRG
jgi:hypothetical protein